MNIQAFNALDNQQIKTLLQHCVHIDHWVNQLIQARPFADKQALLDFAEQQCRLWTWADIQHALDTHPRLGEQQAAKTLTEKEQQLSQQEQAALKLNINTEQQLAAGNREYEQKFGYIFLIKAAGLSAEQVLQQLQHRLKNTAEQEKNVVHQQLTQITLLRLSQLVED